MARKNSPFYDENFCADYKLYLDAIGYAKLEKRSAQRRRISGAIKNANSYCCKTFSWNDLAQLMKNLKPAQFTTFYEYFYFLVENNLYQGDYANYILNNKKHVYKYKGELFRNIYYEGSLPMDFYVSFHEKNGKNVVSRFNLSHCNDFVKDILIDYIENSLTPYEKGCTRFKEFVLHFGKSLENAKQIESITDFNYQTFITQYGYYRNINWGDHKAVTILSTFYLYLDQYIKLHDMSHNLFKLEDPIDKYYLMKANYHIYLDKGYILTFLNPHDSVPVYDNWMVAPNGFENFTISKKGHEYAPISFSFITDQKLKYAFKHWYWFSPITIFSKDKTYYELKTFIEFLDKKISDYRNGIDFNPRKHDVILADILEYKNALQSSLRNRTSYNQAISRIKNFLEFETLNDGLDVDLSVFKILVLRKKPSTTGRSIIKEDLRRIVERYYEMEIEGDLYNRLMLYITYLCVTTNLRLSEVLGLERTCLDETMKKGQFVIRFKPADDDTDNSNNTLKLLRKGGSGEYKDENIDEYTTQMIRKAIAETRVFSDIADDALRKYIFLYKSTKKTIKTITPDEVSRYFSKIINSLGLKDKGYTFYNLRDTFMTNIYDIGKKKNLSIDKIHIATGHTDMRTTIKHYRDSDVRDYLEAFWGVSLGGIDVVGSIEENFKSCNIDCEDEKEAMVSDKCGYCRTKGCNGEMRIDCLICNNFITTIENLASWKLSLERIDKQIKEASREHDIEHLLKKKHIIVAYIEKVYLLKLRLHNERKN